jgi:hypothetical protein
METKLAESSSDTIREEVRQRYGSTARGESSCAGDCCTSTSSDTLGYSTEDCAFAPEAANDQLEKMLRNAGFDRIKIAPKDASRSFIREWLPGKQVEEHLVSATIEATKPHHSGG